MDPLMPERQMRVVLFAATAAAALAGCRMGDQAAATGWTAARDTGGDTIVVRTLSGSEWGGPARLEERVSIGVMDGAEALMLGNVRGLAIGPDGTIYVLESTPALKQFSPSGDYLQTISREGGGPGEYRRPDGGIAALADGRVILRDPGNGRMTAYAPDGATLGTWRINTTFNTSRRLYADTADNTYTLVLMDAADNVADWKFGIQRIGPDGTMGDTIPVPRWEYERAIITGEREGNSSVNDVPFSPNVYWTFSPLGYMVGGLSNQYQIDLFRDDHVLRIERTVEPVPAAAEERADLRRIATENMARNFPGWTWNGPEVPTTKPPFRNVFAGADGRIRVLLSRPGIKDPELEQDDGGNARGFSISPWSEPVVFDVFEPDGRYLGEVAAPDGFVTSPEPVIRGDTVWAIAEDADGVRYVKRYE